MSILEILRIFIVFLPAVILHECAHGWVANKLGDSTAKLAGRLTLNPLKHIDPIGTVMLPALLFLFQSPVLFGWAKPVPVNFRNLRHPKRDMIWVGMAGPAINIILAIVLSLLLKLNISSTAYDLITTAVLVNLVLAIFNLIPIPPLDGSRLVMGLLPSRFALLYSRLENYGIIIVFLLLSFGLLNHVVWPIVVYLAHFLGTKVI